MIRGSLGQGTLWTTPIIFMALLGLALTGVSTSAPMGAAVHPLITDPCNPYAVFGTVWSDINGVLTPVKFAPVAITYNYGNGTYDTHANINGQYQVSSLPCGYSTSTTITITSTPYGGNLTGTASTTITSVSKPGSWLNDTVSYPALTATLNAAPTSGEAPLTVAFSAGPVRGGNGTYVNFGWRFGDTYFYAPGSNNNDTVSHTYSTPGTYKASVFVNDSAGDTAQSATVTITVNVPPALTSVLGNVTATNESQSVSVSSAWTGGTADYSMQYFFGDGTGANDTLIPGMTDSITHTYAKVSGASGFKLGGKVSDSDSKSSTLNPSTGSVNVFDIMVHVTSNVVGGPVDLGQTVTISWSVTGGSGVPADYTYSLHFGDGSAPFNSGTTSTTHSYGAAKTYVLHLTVNDSGSLASDVTVVYLLTVNPALTTILGANVTTIDVGQKVLFTVMPVGGSTPYAYYNISYGDGSNPAANPAEFQNSSSLLTASAQYNVASAPTYTAQARLGDAASMSALSNTVAITVDPLPVLSLTIENSTGAHLATVVGYTNELLDFVGAVTSGGSGGFTYAIQYKAGGGFTAFAAGNDNTQTSYPTAGTYTATLEVKDAGDGFAQTSATVTIYQALVVGALTGNRTAGEIDLSVGFTGTSSGGITPQLQWNWVFGDGNVGLTAVDTVAHTYTSVGNYTAGVVISDSQERVWESVKIFSYPTLTVSINVNSANLNPPLNATLVANLRGGSFGYTSTSWNFGNGNLGTTVVPSGVQTYWHTGIYTITFAETDNASDHTSATYSLSVSGNSAGNQNLTIASGWNLIAMPSTTNNYDLWFLWEAMVLAGAPAATTSVSVQTPGASTNITFPTGAVAANTLVNSGGRGIWIDNGAATSVTLWLSGTSIASLGPENLIGGWNNLGWSVTGGTTAAGIAALLPTGTEISIWDPTAQAYETYIVGFSSASYDFTIADGQGFQVWVPGATTLTE